MGLAFKAHTDDLRESPSLVLVEALVGRGLDVKIHDFEVNQVQLFGANLAEWTRFSHLAPRMVDSLEEIIDSSEVLVLAQHNRDYQEPLAMISPEKILVDLAGIL